MAGKKQRIRTRAMKQVFSLPEFVGKPLAMMTARLRLAVLACLMLFAARPVEALAQAGSQLALSAAYSSDNRKITRGLVWRIYGLADPNNPTLLQQTGEVEPVLALPAGEYVVHVAYGLASATRKVLIGRGTTTERLPISAGALSVRGTILDQPIPITRQLTQVYIPQAGNLEGKQVASALRTGDVLRLPEGVYHIVSVYEDSNSSVRADVRVTSGKLTEAVMQHRAATITLKLVSNAGGEARANTAWSVLTPGGDVIREAVGAFPSMTLAEGDYIAIARNEGKLHQAEFKVRSGTDRDVEVLAQDDAQPAPANGRLTAPAAPAAPARP
jgi:hypothetical protein